ncbi:MAG: MFS transporter [Planctomycetota bacterium]
MTSAARVHDHRTLRSDLRNCTGDGVTHAFMVGLGETNFPLFALALGKGDAVAGLVATVPQLVGAVLQLCAPWGIARVGSPRRWIMLCATIQCLGFVPMVAAAVAGRMPTWTLFAVASLYWAVNLGAAPAWNTWVGALFPRRIRVRYFGWRSRIYQVSIMGSLLLGGAVLMLGDPGRAQRMFGADLGVDLGLMAAFAAVFALAGLSRLWSVWFLKHQGEAPGLDVNSHRRVGLLEFSRRVRARHDGRLLGAVVTMNVAVQVAQPYFTPYMSRQLGFGDAEVLGTIAASFAAKSLAAPFWGRLAQRHGARRLFVWGSLAVVPLSALWMASPSYGYLLALQALTGAAFGAYELGFFLLALEAIREEERTSMMALFMLFNSFAAAAGSVIGSMALGGMGAGMGAYMAIFAASAGARLVAFTVCASVREEVAHAVPLATQPMALRPSAGSIDLPEPASIEEREAIGGRR